MSPSAIVLLVVALVLLSGIAWPLVYGVFAMARGRAVPPARPGTRLVACIGDSITYGWPMAAARWPDNLERLLGSAWSVRNFGASGHTAQESGDRPYRRHRYFALGAAFTPQVVVIMLGSNDAKRHNWAGPERFSMEYRTLIDHYRTLPGRPKVVLMTPPSVFLVHGLKALADGVHPDTIGDIAAATRALGALLALPVVDIHAATAAHPEMFRIDGLHPDGHGERFIARTLHEALPELWAASS